MKKTAISILTRLLVLGTAIGCSSQTDEDTAPIINERNHYRDSEYTATGTYGNLPSHIIVTVTLLKDTITEVHVEPQATNPTSLELQRRFAEAVPQVVVGRHIDDVNVGRLAGSTGTPRGFNDAIDQIRSLAIK